MHRGPCPLRVSGARIHALRRGMKAADSNRLRRMPGATTWPTACSAGTAEPSAVLRAIFGDEDAALRGVRASLGETTTEADVRLALDALGRVLSRRLAT